MQEEEGTKEREGFLKSRRKNRMLPAKETNKALVNVLSLFFK